jgi:hypothetical protein
MPAHFPDLVQVHQQKVVDIGRWDFNFLCCVFDCVRIANIYGFLCCVFDGVRIVNLYSILCCVFDGVRFANLYSFLYYALFSCIARLVLSLVCPLVSLGCPFLIAPSVFSNIYSLKGYHKTTLTLPVHGQESVRSCLCVFRVSILALSRSFCLISIFYVFQVTFCILSQMSQNEVCLILNSTH